MGLFDKLFTKKEQREIYSQVDYNLIFDNEIVDGVPVEEINIGLLNVPTGQIVVCDPLVLPDTLPLKKTIQPGKYPIKIYIAKTNNAGNRYAIAKLELSPHRADKWVLALKDGDDISKLVNDGDYFGFPVDAGLGGFFDYRSGIEYNNFSRWFETEHPGENIYDGLLEKEFKKSALEPNNPNDCGDWLNFTIPNTDFNVTMFQSGYGDGHYPAYWGMKNSGEIVSLIIDFFVLLSPGE